MFNQLVTEATALSKDPYYTHQLQLRSFMIKLKQAIYANPLTIPQLKALLSS
jgi:hypothetical protein